MKDTRQTKWAYIVQASKQDIIRIDELWSARYPGLEPRAESLKDLYPQCWLRFYSLNGGVRYPSGPEELQGIINRHTTVLESLITSDYIFVLTSQWTKDANPSEDDIKKHAEVYQGSYWLSFQEDPEEDDPEFIMYRHIYAERLQWRKRSVDDILSDVAQDKTRGVILASENMDWLYHPYDGGADVITQNETTLDMHKRRFPKWLADD